jgi:hypothetical protein
MPGVTLRGVLPFGHALARPQGDALQTGAIGLLAGLGVGLGLVVPSRARRTASQDDRPPEMPAGHDAN